MSQKPGGEGPATPSPPGDPTWLHRNVGKIFAGVVTLVVAPLFVAIVAPAITPLVIGGPSPAPTHVFEETNGPTAPPLTDTDVRFYRPFTDQGLPPYADVTKVKGGCFSESMTSADPQALRCSYDDVDGSPILDPCWVNVERTQVACPRSPWGSDITLMDPLTELYEDPNADGLATPDPTSNPFAIELVTAAGTHYGCIAIVAYAGDVAGYRRNYDCAPIDNDVVLPGYAFGDPDRSRDLWRIRFAATDSTDLVLVSVVRVWL